MLPCSVELLSGVKSCQAAAVMRADKDAVENVCACVHASVCVCGRVFIFWQFLNSNQCTLHFEHVQEENKKVGQMKTI